MLVALQRTAEDRRLPAAAEHVVGLLRSWGPGPEHLTGLALAGIALPSRLGPRFVDALVFTRYGVVVIAAHEPGPAQWPGPDERAGAGVAAAKGALGGHEGGRYVTGLVAVVPAADPGASEPEADPELWGPEPASAPPGRRPVAGSSEGRSEAAPAPGPGPRRGSWAAPPQTRFEGVPEPGPDPRSSSWAAPPQTRSEGAPAPGPGPQNTPPTFHWRAPEPVPGVAVVLADPRGLRRIIAQHNRWRTVWSADDVLDACYALSLAHLAPPRAALIADGFPARLPVLDRLPELPAVIPVLPEPPPPAAEDDAVAWTPAVRGPGSAVFPRPRPIRQVPWGLVFVLTVLVTVGIVAAVFVAQVFHGS
ncbi:hypothetical protein Q5425_12380 [Amycolatopsis sp. A133]|uniref:hypothetical protein n=1 Tax=Amycolatopsis sp. A133 TaxID=3064472 RepID=UPI0027EF8B3F|nr:hypothetical protein [Amycolatopsis sp. A133]MDQ7804536.1 hypothetical protein [Amycolatopsis sp. A133]